MVLTLNMVFLSNKILLILLVNITELELREFGIITAFIPMESHGFFLLALQSKKY